MPRRSTVRTRPRAELSFSLFCHLTRAGGRCKAAHSKGGPPGVCGESMGPRLHTEGRRGETSSKLVCGSGFLYVI